MQCFHILQNFTEMHLRIYDLGNHSKNAMNEARDIIADALGAQARQRFTLPQAVLSQITGRLKATAEAYEQQGKSYHYIKD